MTLVQENRTRSRLKALELQGYKTFVAKHAFEFAPTITVFVGPNGSGKSNIADSIRWVLGEQSYSLLRGKRTEDMIFSGSETRPRSSMASASIVFDNEDGWLPIDFSEVKISRRAYRDGMNEYLLNGQKVRLKDVSELLAKCGLAQRTYTIVGQGLVDAVLSLNPDERRKLFEEAAGIGLYRSRKEEALRRMDATRRNLERVQDIILELEPRLRSLERQAKRVQEYELVREDLTATLRLWYGYHWFRLRDRVIEARQAAGLRECERDQLRGEQAEAERDLSAIRKQTELIRTRLHQWSLETSELYRQREVAGRKLAVSLERQRWLQEQCVQLQAEILDLNSAKGRLNERMQALALQAEERRKEVMAAEQVFNSFAIGDLEQEAVPQPSSSQLDALHQKLEALFTQKAACAAQIDQLNHRQKVLLTDLQEQRKSLQQTPEALEHEQRREQEAALALEAAGEEIRILGEQKERLRQLLEEIQQRSPFLRDQLSELQARRLVIKTRLELIQSTSQTHDLGKELQTWAETNQKKVFKGWLRDHFRVAPGYEAAIQAALGDFGAALSFATLKGLRAALTHLGEQEGYLALLSPGSLDEAPKVQPASGADCLGNALDFLEVDHEMRPLMEDLLGRTLIVRDRQSAQRLLDALPPNTRIVTLQGDLFHREGHVLLNLSNRICDLGLNLDALRDDLADLERALAECEDAVAQTQLEENDKSEEQRRISQALSDAGLRYQEAQIELERIRLEKERALQQQEERHARIGQSEDELESIGSKVGALNEEERLHEATRSDLEIRIQEVFSEASLSQPRIERAQAQVELGSARRAQQDLESRYEELADQLKSAEAQLGEQQARLTKATDEAQSTARQSEQFEREVKEVDEHINLLNLKIGPEEESLSNLEGKRSALEAEEARLRSALRKAEQKHSEGQIEMARLEEELGALQRRIEEDFGLVSFEFENGMTGQEPLPLEGLVERLHRVEQLPEGIDRQMKQLRTQLRRIGVINPEAKREYTEVRARVEFLSSQMEDARQAETQIRDVIDEIDQLMERDFRMIFEAVAKEFRSVFTRLFGGGEAELILTDPENLTETGIDIEARLPGRREQGLAMLSGGERSLTASALIFSLMKVSPTPFCVLDEVDAMLDDVNVIRFREMLQELCKETQFVVITHNRETVQAAEVIFGVTMGADSASQVISLKMEEAEKVLSR